MEMSELNREIMKENECKNEFPIIPVLISEEDCVKVSKSPDPILSSYNEEVSYHELRCLSSEDLYETNYMLPMEYEECDDIINIIQQPNFEHNFHKFYKTESDNCISSTENTDDQLFIEIVKEEINFRHEQNEETSIFDSVTFSSRDENIEHIIVDKEDKMPKLETATQPARFFVFKKPQEHKSSVVTSQTYRLKERYKNHRKPLGLANYKSLITEAIRSSPEKRMILTEIYKWITENIPFFKEKELRGKDGWKNCIRHTLSVNDNFVRLKNQTKGKSSYWTVYDDFKKYPWTSEVFTPGERRTRGRPRIYKNLTDKIVKRLPKMKRKRISIDEKKFVTKKRKRGRPRIHKIDMKNLTKNMVKKRRQRTKIKKKVNKSNKFNNVTNKPTNTAVRTLRRSQRNVRESLKNKSNCNGGESIRRSSRKRVIRKVWTV